mmetsp:Transcript_107624/g.347326  ORF Transcript_107624/g.347326 Transcript_107624/m.347326 type:complete len:251 (-) Transcript_107624:880-1632(-)
MDPQTPQEPRAPEREARPEDAVARAPSGDDARPRGPAPPMRCGSCFVAERGLAPRRVAALVGGGELAWARAPRPGVGRAAMPVLDADGEVPRRTWRAGASLGALAAAAAEAAGGLGSWPRSAASAACCSSARERGTGPTVDRPMAERPSRPLAPLTSARLPEPFISAQGVAAAASSELGASLLERSRISCSGCKSNSRRCMPGMMLASSPVYLLSMSRLCWRSCRRRAFSSWTCSGTLVHDTLGESPLLP